METLDRIRENIGKVIIGKEEQIDLVLTALLAGGHVLLDDVPGTGKTMLSRALAASLSLSFSRIQFTPDLLPTDITGLDFYSRKENEFIFREGPVFCIILLADEINRATPRTQSALLECMEEHQVTVDGVTRPLEEPFFVIATQNPVETTGTFPLPEAELDRFLMKLSMGSPSMAEEAAILNRFLTDEPLKKLTPVSSKEELLACRAALKKVFIHPLLIQMIVDIARQTRKHEYILSGVSPRGSLALANASRAYAFLKGRDFVEPEDIKTLAVPVLAHRIIPDRAAAAACTTSSLISSILEEVTVPTENWKK